MFCRRTLMPLLLASVVLVPSVNADVFIYDVLSDVEQLHVKFELPVFEQVVLNQAAFDFETWDRPVAITSFTISGGSASCVVGGPEGPCWAASGGTTSAITSVSPFFNGPGAFTETVGGVTTRVTISDVPEPSAVILLSGALVGVVIVTRKRRFTRRRRGAEGVTRAQHCRELRR